MIVYSVYMTLLRQDQAAADAYRKVLCMGLTEVPWPSDFQNFKGIVITKKPADGGHV